MSFLPRRPSPASPSRATGTSVVGSRCPLDDDEWEPVWPADDPDYVPPDLKVWTPEAVRRAVFRGQIQDAREALIEVGFPWPGIDGHPAEQLIRKHYRSPWNEL